MAQAARDFSYLRLSGRLGIGVGPLVRFVQGEGPPDGLPRAWICAKSQDRDVVDALRAVLGLGPLYATDHAVTHIHLYDEPVARR